MPTYLIHRQMGVSQGGELALEQGCLKERPGILRKVAVGAIRQWHYGFEITGLCTEVYQ